MAPPRSVASSWPTGRVQVQGWVVRASLGGMVLRARSLKPTDLPWNASSCRRRVTWGQALLPETQFPPLSNGVDHISPRNLGSVLGVTLESV